MQCLPPPFLVSGGDWAEAGSGPTRESVAHASVWARPKMGLEIAEKSRDDASAVISEG